MSYKLCRSLYEKNGMNLCFALKLRKRRVLGDVEIREDQESTVHAKDHGGNTGGPERNASRKTRAAVSFESSMARIFLLCRLRVSVASPPAARRLSTQFTTPYVATR